MRYVLNTLLAPVDGGAMLVSPSCQLDTEILDDLRLWLVRAVSAIDDPSVAALLGIEPASVTVVPRRGDEAIIVRRRSNTVVEGLDDLEVQFVRYEADFI